MARNLKSDSDQKYTGVHSEVLKSLVSKCASMKSEMDEARGELGAAIKDAEDTHGIHRKAFKLALTLRNIEDAPRADFLRALNDYIAKLGLDAQGDLFDERDDDEDGEDEAPRETIAAAKVEGIERLKSIKPLN